MPYVSIKCYPKDPETSKEVVKRINEALIDVWGCSQESISISLEEVDPEAWEATVVKKEIEPKADKMMILSGKKKF